MSVSLDTSNPDIESLNAFPCVCLLCQTIHTVLAETIKGKTVERDGGTFHVKHCGNCEAAIAAGTMNLHCPRNVGGGNKICGKYIGPPKKKGVNFCPNCKKPVYWWEGKDGAAPTGWGFSPQKTLDTVKFQVDRMEALLNADEELFEVFTNLMDNNPTAERETVLRMLYNEAIQDDEFVTEYKEIKL